MLEIGRECYPGLHFAIEIQNNIVFVMKQNGKPTKYVLASLEVDCDNRPVRMAETNEAHHAIIWL